MVCLLERQVYGKGRKESKLWVQLVEKVAFVLLDTDCIGLGEKSITTLSMKADHVLTKINASRLVYEHLIGGYW